MEPTSVPPHAAAVLYLVDTARDVVSVLQAGVLLAAAITHLGDTDTFPLAPFTLPLVGAYLVLTYKSRALNAALADLENEVESDRRRGAGNF